MQKCDRFFKETLPFHCAPDHLRTQVDGSACVQLWHFNKPTAHSTLIALLPTSAAEVRALSWCPCSILDSTHNPAVSSRAADDDAAPPPARCFLLAAALSSGQIEVCLPVSCLKSSHLSIFESPTPTGVVHPRCSSCPSLYPGARPPVCQRRQLRALGCAAPYCTSPRAITMRRRL